MAATAYSSLVSLMKVLTRYQNPTCPVPFDQSQIQTLLDKVTSLVDFLEHYYDSPRKTKTSSGSIIQALQRNIIRAANAAEDLIETSYVNRVLIREELELCPDLHNSIQEMDQIFQDTMDVRVKRHKVEHQEDPLALVHVRSSSRLRDNNTMVGFDKQLKSLMDKIRESDKQRMDVIIPIVGMGGIGKTTLATHVFKHQYARQNFDNRAWVTVSRNYVVKNMLVSLLRDMNVEIDDQMDDEQLESELHTVLFDSRYFIVLDDIWDIQAWDEIRGFFPDNKNGSRILLTTRDHSVARRVGSSEPYEMEFLNDDESFNLLSEKVYGPEVFPSELEILGKEIAKNCKGLLLTIVVIAGLLKTCSKTIEYWKEFAESLSSIIKKDNSEQCLGILLLSYTHLPIHLKPCFLHMATFEEDAKIDVHVLINLWIADGFLKPTNNKNLNDIALEYLNALVDRNLIVANGQVSWARKIVVVGMHDSLRELCLREAESEDFLCVVDEDTPNLQQTLQRARRIVFKYSRSGSKYIFPSTPYARSIRVIGARDSSTILDCMLLRVIDSMRTSKLQMNIPELVNVYYLQVLSKLDAEKWRGSLPLLWNLETLIFAGDFSGPPLPSEIWNLQYLRHLEYKKGVLSPLSSQNSCVLTNLQTIWGVEDFLCTNEIHRRIPNLKKLSILWKIKAIDDAKLIDSFNNLALLHKLEILNLSC